MEPLIISISGVRGIVGESLGPLEATRFGLAYGTFLTRQATSDASPRVVLGRDSRPSGPMLAAAVEAGLLATGCHTVRLGIVSTPGAALMARELNCDGGVVITASHNPTPYNGIKFLRNDGIAYPADQVRQIHRCYHDSDFDLQPAQATGRSETNHDTHAMHVRKVLDICDPALIRSRHFKVVLDSINGAGCVGAAQLLAELGCDLVHLNNEPNGLFAHKPEPTADNLADLGRHILPNHAAVGFAQDPDADRLALVDEKGRYIGEEYTLALAARYVFAHRKGSAAANLSTSRMIDDLAQQADCDVIRTPVGEAHVANTMLAHHCVIGGEGNGGVIDLRVVPVRDSFVGIALILQLLAETNEPLSKLVAEIPAYHMKKTKFPCPADRAAPVLAAVQQHYEKAVGPAAIDSRDGIRIDFDNAWVQLRASNTEPIVRLIAESRDPALTDRLIEQVRTVAGL